MYSTKMDNGPFCMGIRYPGQCLYPSAPLHESWLTSPCSGH